MPSLRDIDAKLDTISKQLDKLIYLLDAEEFCETDEPQAEDCWWYADAFSRHGANMGHQVYDVGVPD